MRRVYDGNGVLKSFCARIPDPNLYDLIQDLNTMVEVSEDDEIDAGGVVLSARLQSLIQKILTLSGSMSEVLEVVKRINKDNEWRMQGMSDRDLERETGEGWMFRPGMEAGKVWLNLERQKRNFAGFEDSERKGGCVYPYCEGLLRDFFDRNRRDISIHNELVLQKLFQETGVTSSTIIDTVAQIFVDESKTTRFWGTSGRMAYNAAPFLPKIMSPDGKTDRTFIVWLLRRELKDRWLSGKAALEFERIPIDGQFLHVIESEARRVDEAQKDARDDPKRQKNEMGDTSLAKMRGMLKEIQLA
jgi:hypothetical protein